MDVEQITQEELDEIERLDREATPGPWEDADGLLLMAIFSQGAWREPTEADEEFSLRARSLLPRLARVHRSRGEEHIAECRRYGEALSKLRQEANDAYARGQREAIEYIEEVTRDLAQSGLANDAAALRRLVEKMKVGEETGKDLSSGR